MTCPKNCKGCEEPMWGVDEEMLKKWEKQDRITLWAVVLIAAGLIATAFYARIYLLTP